MIVRRLILGELETNCYLVGCASTREAIVIDPAAEPERILAAAHTEGLRITLVAITHAHFDHMLAAGAIVSATGAPLALHPLELPLYREGGGAPLFGLPAPQLPEPTVWLEHGASLAFGDERMEVILTPGHSPGHVCFHHARGELLFDGDLLFYGGVGRTDLPGGNPAALMASIRTHLAVLPLSTRVLPGHGPETTIGAELTSNPWLAR